MKLRFAFVLLLTFRCVLSQGPTLPGTARIPPARPPAGEPVTGAPYSAERIITEDWNVQRVHPGGVPLAPSAPHVVREYRDSAGRTRTELSFTFSPGGTERWTLVTIVDLAAGVQYVMVPEVENHIAHRQVLPRALPKTAAARPDISPWIQGGPGCCGSVNRTVEPAESGSNGPDPNAAAVDYGTPFIPAVPPGMKVKKLGSRTIEGLTAKGLLYTSPEKMNGHPLKTREEWTVADLHLTVLSKEVLGVVVTMERLVHITPTEPDPALFQPPPDAKVVDEPGGFNISLRH